MYKVELEGVPGYMGTCESYVRSEVGVHFAGLLKNSRGPKKCADIGKVTSSGKAEFSNLN